MDKLEKANVVAEWYNKDGEIDPLMMANDLELQQRVIDEMYKSEGQEWPVFKKNVHKHLHDKYDKNFSTLDCMVKDMLIMDGEEQFELIYDTLKDFVD